MLRLNLPCSLTALGVALVAFTSPARAHIRLLDPVARYEIQGFDTGIKSCPCGLGGSNRTCNVAVDGSDPDRVAERVSRFEAGSTITLRFEEYVDHTGTFRVAFDENGADVADFNANVLVPIVPDPPGGSGNVGEGAIWEIDVVLPDMTCNNCTLQLVQAMNNDMVNAVADPTNTSSYYACVDLELVAPGTLGEPGEAEPGGPEMPDQAPNEGDMPTSDGNMAGSSGAANGSSGAANGSSGGSMGSGMGAVPTASTDRPSGATSMAGGQNTSPAATVPGATQTPGGSMLGDVIAPQASSSSGGCSLRAPGSSPVAALLALGLITTLATRRRVRPEPARLSVIP